MTKKIVLDEELEHIASELKPKLEKLIDRDVITEVVFNHHSTHKNNTPYLIIGYKSLTDSLVEYRSFGRVVRHDTSPICGIDIRIEDNGAKHYYAYISDERAPEIILNTLEEETRKRGYAPVEFKLKPKK
jgi:hypothetical protein